MMGTAFGRTVVGLLLFGGMALNAAAQTPRHEEGRLVIKATLGQDLFQFYCSTCHGGDGKGRPKGAASRPPDLTTLVRRNGGGTFPGELVRASIANGRSGSMRPHRWSVMPAWGAIFHGLDASEAITEIRLAALVEYIESLQEAELLRAGELP